MSIINQVQYYEQMLQAAKQVQAEQPTYQPPPTYSQQAPPAYSQQQAPPAYFQPQSPPAYFQPQSQQRPPPAYSQQPPPAYFQPQSQPQPQQTHMEFPRPSGRDPPPPSPSSVSLRVDWADASDTTSSPSVDRCASQTTPTGLEHIVEELRNELAAEKESNEGLRDKYRSLQDDLTAEKESNEGLRDKYRSLQDKYRVLQDKNESLQDDLIAEKEKCSKLVGTKPAKTTSGKKSTTTPLVEHGPQTNSEETEAWTMVGDVSPKPTYSVVAAKSSTPNPCTKQTCVAAPSRPPCRVTALKWMNGEVSEFNRFGNVHKVTMVWGKGTGIEEIQKITSGHPEGKISENSALHKVGFRWASIYRFGVVETRNAGLLNGALLNVKDGDVVTVYIINRGDYRDRIDDFGNTRD